MVGSCILRSLCAASVACGRGFLYFLGDGRGILEYLLSLSIRNIVKRVGHCRKLTTADTLFTRSGSWCDLCLSSFHLC